MLRGRASHKHKPPPQAFNIHEIGSIIGRGRIIGSRMLEGTIVNERYEEGRVIEQKFVGGERVVQKFRKEQQEEEVEVVEEIEEVIVEQVVERTVPRVVYVDKIVDVKIIKPVKRIVEKEVIVEKIEEIPVEKIIEYNVEKEIKVPQVEVVEEIKEVEKIIKVPILDTVIDEVPKLSSDDQVHEEFAEVALNELAQLKRTRPVHEVLETDVRVTHQKKINEVADYQVNMVQNLVNIPIYHFQEEIQEVLVPKETVFEDEVETFVHNEENHTNIIKQDNPVEQIIVVENEVPAFTHGDEAHDIQEKNVVTQDYHYTTTIEDEEPAFTHAADEHVINNVVAVDRFQLSTENKTVVAPYETPVPLQEVTEQRQVFEVGKPVKVPAQRKVQDIEYNLTQTQPQPENRQITIRVPQARRVDNESVIQVPVPMNVIVEQPQVTEKLVDVEVVTKVEQAEYTYNETKIPMTFDVIINRKYEVIKEVPVEVKVPKQIEVPTRIVTQNPVENMEHFE